MLSQEKCRYSGIKQQWPLATESEATRYPFYRSSSKKGAGNQEKVIALTIVDHQNLYVWRAGVGDNKTNLGEFLTLVKCLVIDFDPGR